MHVKLGNNQENNENISKTGNSLALFVLGTFEAQVNETRITDQFRTDKERALLTYLIWEAQRPHRRETLGELLWPEREEGVARTNLRQAILGMRRAVGDGSGSASFFNITNEFVQLAPQSTPWLDAALFTNHLKFTYSHPHPSVEECPTCVQQLETAVALYRGDFLDTVFVESPAFQEWVVVRRETLFRELLTALQTLTEYYQRHNEYDTARKFALKHVALYPLEERAHRQLMRLYVLGGQRSAALEQYQMCRVRLLDELGVEPGAQTQALYEQIRQGTPLIPPAAVTINTDTDHVQAPPPHNLPEPLTSFIGREEEIGQLTRCLKNPICRLITLIGPPGVGKTRLAVHAAKAGLERFTDGIWFIPTETVHPAGGLMPAIAKTIGFVGDGQSVQVALLQYLQTKKMLLVLDGFEHLKQSSDPLLEILGCAPQVKIMVTSRERLNYQVACIFEIGGLTYPNASDEFHAEEYPAVRLFLNRALHRPGQTTVHTKDLQEVVKICKLLEGLPLAVELAAASVHKYGYSQIATEIQNNLALLKTSMLDVPERHRSMHAAINQSWHLLTEEEKIFFARLSIFQDTFSFEAAARITGIDASTLASLIDKSLVEMDETRRYKLQLILRNFAAEKLQDLPDEAYELYTRFSQYFMAFLYERKAEPDKQLPLYAFQEMVPEVANIRVAWGWVTSQQDFEKIAQGLETLWDFFNLHDALKEGEEAFRTCVTALRASMLPDAGMWLSKALAGLAWFLARQGEYEAASRYYLQSIACFETHQSYAELVFPHFGNGFVAYQLGEYAKAKDSFEASACAGEKAGETNWSAMARVYLALLRNMTGESPDPEKDLRDILMSFERTGNLHGRLRTLKHLGDVAHTRGHLTQASAYYTRALELAKQIGQKGMVAPLQLKLGTIASEQGDYPRAKEILENCLQVFQYVADQKDEALTYRELGSIAALQDHFQEAHQHFRKALELAVATGQRPLMLEVLSGIACMFAKTQRLETAWELLGLIRVHPATHPLTLRRISELLQTCLDSPNRERQETAQQRGSTLMLENVVEEFRLLL